MTALASLLLESDLTDFKSLVYSHLDSITDLYATSAIGMHELSTLIYHGDASVLGFVSEAIKSGRATDEQERAKCDLPVRFCYYNALSYAYRNPDVDLAFGIVLERDWMIKLASKKRVFLEATLHAFTVRGGRIVDPTWDDEADGVYCYEVIPRSTWETFPFNQDDKNFNGAAVRDYAAQRIKDYNFNAVSDAAGMGFSI
jgi:hypothetical protein